MPTPHGSRGGMAFSADELRVLRRALAQVLHPPSQPSRAQPAPRPQPASRPQLQTEDVQDVLRLAEAIDEAVDEAGRMRAFALADLARYRNALPGSAAGYLERLRDAVADGYVPQGEDLSALRTLTSLPCAPAERLRRLELRSHCGEVAEAEVVRRLTVPPPPSRPVPPRSLPRPPQPLALVADVRVAALRAGNVAEFARPARPQRPRELSRPFPIRTGGPTAMDSYAAAPRPADQDRTEDPAPKRPIPTPADLFPRGVRRDTEENREGGEGGDEDGKDGELATGTG